MSVTLGIPTARPHLADASLDAAMPTSGPLLDTFGRTATDLRVSLTDRCNLRCTYCMPAAGLDWLPTDAVLSTAEVIRVIGIGIGRLGIRAVRFTGGEPLLRRDLTEIVRATRATARAQEASVDIAMTTNALGLRHHATALAAAGLNRVNVSLDTLDPDRFAAITRRDRLSDVVAGLQAARDAGLTPVKINTVLETATDLAHLGELVDFAVTRGFELRVIEKMPLEADHTWDRAAVITAERVLSTLRTAGRQVTVAPRPRGSDPAQAFDVTTAHGAQGTFGVIASVTEPFCAACNRTRLTADGCVRNCLFARGEVDLRPLLRGGADDTAIELAWRAAMWEKQAGHGISDPQFTRPDRPMSAIGG